MTFDPDRRRTVLIGGQRHDDVRFNETWDWDGTNWTQRFDAASFAPRTGIHAAYDERRKRAVFFGGFQSPPPDPGTVFGDTWELEHGP